MDNSNPNSENGRGKANYLDILVEVDKFMAEKGMKIPVYTDKSWEQLSCQYENARKTDDTSGMRDAMGEMLASYYQDQRPFSEKKRRFIEIEIPVVVACSLAENSERGLAVAARLLDDARYISAPFLSPSVFIDQSSVVAGKAVGLGNLAVALHFASTAATESRKSLKTSDYKKDTENTERHNKIVELLLKIGEEAEKRSSCDADKYSLIACKAYEKASEVGAYDPRLTVRSARKYLAKCLQPS